MILEWKLLIILFSVLIGLNFIIFFMTGFIKWRSKWQFRNKEKYQSYINSLVSGDSSSIDKLTGKKRIRFLIVLQKWTKSFVLPDEVSGIIKPLIQEWHVAAVVEKKLNSKSQHNRAEGLLLVELLGHDVQLLIMEKTLVKEKSVLLKLKIIECLISLNLLHSLDIIIETMRNSSELFRKKVIHFLAPYNYQLEIWADKNRENHDDLIRRILITAASSGHQDWYFQHLMKETGSQNREIRLSAAETLFHSVYPLSALKEILDSPYDDVKELAIEKIFKHIDADDLEHLNEYLQNDNLREAIIRTLKNRTASSPELISPAFRRFKESVFPEERKAWAEILSGRISYFLFRIKSENDQSSIENLIIDVVSLGHTSQIINFLNQNRNQDLEMRLKKILKPLLIENQSFRKQCRLYLRMGIQEKWNIPEYEKEISEPKLLLKTGDKILMALLMFTVLSIPLLSYYLINRSIIPYYTAGELFVTFIFHYHYIFAYYNIVVNSIYLILIALSWSVINKQEIQWQLLDRKFLYTPGVLPPVSILAPCYNEEKTIIQNVYSLLALDYNDYEVIIIDDGSSDGTMRTLIDIFRMELWENEPDEQIPTAPVQGVYRSRDFPDLLLVSKLNGGKADALNAGINFSKGDYICSIDADSLLEPDSLQKVMARSLDHDEETVAIGGNVLPSNGSIVKEGMIREIHLPKNPYARFQTIEYLRSFISNRLGWSKLNSLLVISGAFGVFKKERILEIGGYLTGKGKLRKDTVGEDMEIVVHLYENMIRNKRPFHVDYAYNANCWTEVPENLESLVKQRDRWHRGLIEVMMYHKNILFNRKFGSIGFLAFPYFFIFELLGPFLEATGYLFLLIPFFMGLLDVQVILFMLAIAIILGILISALSLYMAEKGVLYFKGRDYLSIILTAIMENFGYRQFMSLLRPVSFFLYIFRKRDKGWEKLQRIGFLVETEEETAKT